MKSIVVWLVLLASVLASCAPTPLPPPTAALPPTITPAPASSPTASLPTVTSTATPALLSIAYYRLRFEFSSTSDWTTLEFSEGGSGILSLRLIEKIGAPTNAEAQPLQLNLNQSLDDSRRGQTIGLTVDYAFSPDAIEQPIRLILRKGDLGASALRVYLISREQSQLLQEATHRGAVPNSGGLNPLSIQLDLASLKETAPAQAQIQARRAGHKMLWAFYYPWYSSTDWSSSQLNDRAQTPYASSDPEAIRRQIEQAQQAGIDGFISSWWGPGDYTDRNLQILLRLAQEKNFSVSIYFETLAGDGPRNEEEIFRWLSYAIDTHGSHPAFFKVDGKPVIVLWASGAVPLASWQSIFARLREQGKDALFLGMGYNLANLDVFDGIHEYGIFTIPNLADVYQNVSRSVRYYSLLSDAPTDAKIWAATVQPGYDDRLIPGREGLFQDRQNGQVYRDTFEAALRSDPDWIFITTWNEWWEHTYIEPSELFGDLYLRITREFADAWKNGE